jgi:TP901 family phage tail tape measure protein
MAAENPIRYQDLISPDDSIEKLIQQLEQLQDAYTGMAQSVKQQAQGVASSLQQVSGATKQGQKTISEANEEAKRLEQAYKKLDAAYASNAKEIAKLNVLRREANNYNKNLVLRGKEEIKTKEQIKNASYAQLSAQYSLNKAYINSLNAVERNTKANREYIKTTKEIYEQMKRLQEATGKNQLNVGNYGDALKNFGSIAFGIGSMAAAGTAAIGVLRNNINTAKEYEKSVSVLAAILGTTSDKIGELTEQSKNLGATTVFTASEVTQLQTELAKLGYSIQDILNMSPSVLNFAQATGSSLADAASLTGAALRMFEKDTTDTTEFVDKMTAATTKSALSFNYLNNALSTVAPVANAFGFKLEEVLALLGQLANAGFDASSAATATRNILLNLADANGKLAQALGEPVTDLDSLIDGLQSLNNRGIDLAETLELTDKRSVAAFNTFLSGTDNVKRLRDELNKSNGAAQDMAKTMGDNLEGSLKSLDSAWEGFNLHLNTSNGLIRDMVDWLTKVVRWLDKGLSKLDDLWKKYGWMLGGSKQDAQEAFVYAAEQKFGNAEAAGSGTSSSTSGGTQNKAAGGGTGSGAGKLSAKEQKAAQAAAKRALMEQEQQEKESLALRRKYEDTMLEIITDESSREYAKVQYKYSREIEDLQIAMEKKKAIGKLSIEDEKLYNDQIAALVELRDQKLIETAEKYDKKDRQEREHREREAKQAAQQTLRERERAIELEYDIEMEGIDQLQESEKEKTRMRLEAEKKRLAALLKLYEADGNKLHDKEIELIKKQIEGVDKELQKNAKSGDIYDMLGFKLDDEQKQAIDQSLSYALDSLNSFMDSYVQAAEKKKQLADQAVESAQTVLEKEIEARNNGFANEVETARQELEEAKKNQRKALDEQKKAQRAQQIVDAASQASSLITATANIWKVFTGMGPAGPALAIAATALLWGSFAASKIKAMQVAGMGTEEYGEGTVELLQGGSHQSGNDIDLGRTHDGRRRRAEGGEFFAVINKRNSRKYRDVIPDVVHSLNDGTFAEKYMNAYAGGNIEIGRQDAPVDISQLSDDVQAIREQGEHGTYVDGNGNTVMRYKNLRRIIRR